MATQTSTTQTKPSTSRSRRKLNFGESQRFKGKTFFLDLCGYRKVKHIEEELTLRGATIQKFLDKSVRYIVTNRSKDDIRQAYHMKTTPSGQSPHTPSTGGLSHLMSPYSNQSSSSDKRTTKPAYYTRAQKILQMSLEKNQGSGISDVLANAVNWNCKILHVEAVEKELKKLKPVAISKGDGIKKAINMGSVRKLREPFLKVEDLSRQYCPIIYEPSSWPTINLSCSPRSCPFDPPRPDAPAPPPPHDGKGGKHRKDVDKRMGYCENCAVRFDDLEMHLKSAKHQEYASNPKNFERLDKLISQCTSVDDFVKDLIKQHTASVPSSLEKSPSPLKKGVYPEGVSMVSLPSREGPLVIHSDYPVHEQSPGVCTRQMKRKLVESSPNLPPDRKRSRMGF